MPAQKKIRTLVESSDFRQDVARISKCVKRLDEHLSEATRKIAQSPDSFAEISGTGLRRAEIGSNCDFPALYLVFSFDADNVHLCRIEEADHNVGDKEESLAR